MHHTFRSESDHTLEVVIMLYRHTSATFVEGVNQRQVETPHIYVHCAAGMAVLHVLSVFPSTPTWIVRKPMKCTEILSTFHTSQIHFSTNNTSFRPFKRMGAQMSNNRG